MAYYFILSQTSEFLSVRKEVDAVLYPSDNPFADDGLAPVGFGESSRKVGIDLGQVSDIESLFDDFDVG